MTTQRPVSLVAAMVTLLALCWGVPAAAQVAVADDVPHTGDDPFESVFSPAAGTPITIERAPVVELVGIDSSFASGLARARGNAFRIDTATGLIEAEFYLQFSDVQTLSFYVYHSPIEVGVYTQVFTTSAVVTGSGIGWYSSGLINYRLEVGNYYIIAVSWDGTVGYFFGLGDSQVTSFGEQVHGYADNTQPLPATFFSGGLDEVIYYQRLTTDVDVPVELQRFTVE